MIRYFIFGAVISIALFAGWKLLQKQPLANQPQTQQSQQGHQEESGGYGTEKPFYSKDGISLQHYWPGEGSFSNEETEILLFNESSSSVQVKLFDLTYTVEGKAYPHKSGTWEKFATKTSWERIEYINISLQHYQGQPLTLARGEKGKLHWHINFGPQPLNGKQTVQVKLTLLTNGTSIPVTQTLTRDSGTVVNKEDH